MASLGAWYLVQGSPGHPPGAFTTWLCCPGAREWGSQRQEGKASVSVKVWAEDAKATLLFSGSQAALEAAEHGGQGTSLGSWT